MLEYQRTIHGIADFPPCAPANAGIGGGDEAPRSETKIIGGN